MDAEQVDGLWDWSEPAASEQRCRDVGTPEAITQAGRDMGLQNLFVRAHAMLVSVDVRVPFVAIRSNLQRGRLFNSAGDHVHAAPLFASALLTARERGSE